MAGAPGVAGVLELCGNDCASAESWDGAGGLRMLQARGLAALSLICWATAGSAAASCWLGMRGRGGHLQAQMRGQVARTSSWDRLACNTYSELSRSGPFVPSKTPRAMLDAQLHIWRTAEHLGHARTEAAARKPGFFTCPHRPAAQASWGCAIWPPHRNPASGARKDAPGARGGRCPPRAREGTGRNTFGPALLWAQSVS